MILDGGKQSSNSDYNKVRIAVISWTSALSEYKHEAQPKLSRYLPNCTMCDHFPDISQGFFSSTESEISEQASRQVATEEPN